jgi:hypothetical protein
MHHPRLKQVLKRRLRSAGPAPGANPWFYMGIHHFQSRASHAGTARLGKIDAMAVRWISGREAIHQYWTDTLADDKELKHWIIHNPEGLDFEFEGRLLGEAWNGAIGTLQVYETSSGRFVATQFETTGGTTSRKARAAVFDDKADILPWLGYSATAKSLASQIGLTTSQTVD